MQSKGLIFGFLLAIVTNMFNIKELFRFIYLAGCSSFHFTLVDFSKNTGEGGGSPCRTMQILFSLITGSHVRLFTEHLLPYRGHMLLVASLFLLSATIKLPCQDDSYELHGLRK